LKARQALGVLDEPVLYGLGGSIVDEPERLARVAGFALNGDAKERGHVVLVVVVICRTLGSATGGCLRISRVENEMSEILLHACGAARGMYIITYAQVKAR
jgi:hypothetical protein